jgi:hypothetical protein
MKTACYVLTAVLASCAAAGYSLAHVPEGSLGSGGRVVHEPDIVIERYLRAVDRGELVALGQVLDRSMLTPVSVEYVYRLDRGRPIVKVYSELRKPVPVPGQHGCTLRAVSAVLDSSGRIIEIEAHIWSTGDPGSD